ncbi:MAG: glutamyl-tRNA synthetase [Hyphomicrobiales bacterium]|nr:glutamyl-tRNA synthetase [Hyphomicrobiales bacterium]
MTAPVVRFAPSPTGRIHIGNARTALFNWLFAKKHGGRFVLRFDDTDLERSRREYADGIETDLNWLGVEPDMIVRQSERFALYDDAMERLRAQGRIYACYETQEELDRKRKRLAARGLPPVYDRAGLNLTQDERDQLEASGRKPHWRFQLERTIVEWDDLSRGPSRIDCASLSDPVMAREDGTYLYTLPSVVDDVALGVTHIIRGEDHVTNTAVQLQLFAALAPDAAPPTFAHHNLLASASGEGLSKRTGSLSLASLRDAGMEAMAVASIAVLTGSSDSVQPFASLDELAAVVDISHVSHHAARFDEAELAMLSARTLHLLPFEAVRERLAAFEIVGHNAEAFWLAVRPNLTKLSDAQDWRRVVEGEITPVIEDEEMLRAAAALLPEEPWDAGTWRAWTDAVKAQTGRKGKALFHPLRLALTGLDKGPELAALLPLIGRVRALARLPAAG